MNILVINGPNLNMLGIREPDIYGSDTYEGLCRLISQHAETIGVSVEIYQSNPEGCLVDKIQEAYGVFDGIVLNAGGYTHTSVAIADAIPASEVPSDQLSGYASLLLVLERDEVSSGVKGRRDKPAVLS